MKRIYQKLFFIYLGCFLMVLSACGTTKKALDAPKISLDQDVVTWQSVPGATNYIISLNSIYLGNVVSSGKESYQFHIVWNNPGVFSITVIAEDGDIKSEPSNLVIYNKVIVLKTPTVHYDGKHITWDKVSDAISYDVYLNDDKKANVLSTTYDISKNDDGEYEISVIAIGSGNGYCNSEPSEKMKIHITKALDAQKAIRKNELDKIFAQYPSDRYQNSEWLEMRQWVRNAKAEIDALDSIEAVNTYSIDALAARLNGVKTKAQHIQEELALAKEEKNKEIDDLLLTYNENDYRIAEWQALEQLITDAKNEVNSFTTINLVNDYETFGLTEQLAAIKTKAILDAEELVPAKNAKLSELDQLLENYNSMDYDEESWQQMVNIIANAKDDVENIDNKAEVLAYDLAVVQTNLASVQTKEQLLAEQKTEALAKLNEISQTVNQDDYFFYEYTGYKTITSRAKKAIENAVYGYNFQAKIDEYQTYVDKMQMKTEPFAVSTYGLLFKVIDTHANCEGLIIKLTDNIVLTKDISIARFMYDITLDLNGFTLSNGMIKIVNQATDGSYYSNSIKVKITDNSEAKTGKIVNEKAENYAVLIQGNEMIDVTIENITLESTWGGIYTNGSSNGMKVTMKNAKAISSDCGAYLAAYGTYYFEDTTFEGATGLAIKSGDMTAVRCHFIGTGVYIAPTYDGNGVLATGSAVLIEPTKGYHPEITVRISDSELNSANGYAVEVFEAAPSGEEAGYQAIVEGENNIEVAAKNN